MNDPKRTILLAAILLLSTLSVHAAPDLQLRMDEEVWDKPISLDLVDADLRRVYALMFQIAESQVTIDDCVQGRVTLKFENVSLREALASTVRMGDFVVRPRRSGYFIGCAGHPEERAAATEDDLVRLEFTLTETTDGSVVSRPTLLVRYDETAEIELGRKLDVEDLDDTGRFFSLGAQPSLRIKVYVDRDEEGVAPDLLRGVTELTALDDDESRTRRMIAQSFERLLPAGTTALLVARFDLGDESYELTVSRLPGTRP